MLKFVLAAPVLLLIPFAGALAQAGGSYRGSCTNINQDGSTLTAECRGIGGQRVISTIDTSRCRGVGIANSNGRLTCGNVEGSSTETRRGGDFGDNGGGFQRARPRAPRYDLGSEEDAGYGAPRRRRHFDESQQQGYQGDQGGRFRGGDQGDEEN